MLKRLSGNSPSSEITKLPLRVRHVGAVSQFPLRTKSILRSSSKRCFSPIFETLAGQNILPPRRLNRWGEIFKKNKLLGEI